MKALRVSIIIVLAFTFAPVAMAETAEEKAQRLFDEASFNVENVYSLSNYVMAMRSRELARKLNNPEKLDFWEQRAIEGAAATKDLCRRVASLFPSVSDFAIESESKNKKTNKTDQRLLPITLKPIIISSTTHQSATVLVVV